MREADEIRTDCARKLEAVEVSGMFKAVVACLLGEVWTTPHIEELIGVPGVETLLLESRGPSSAAPLLSSLGVPLRFAPRHPRYGSVRGHSDVCFD